jgi:hypothetical protein
VETPQRSRFQATTTLPPLVAQCMQGSSRAVAVQAPSRYKLMVFLLLLCLIPSPQPLLLLLHLNVVRLSSTGLCGADLAGRVTISVSNNIYNTPCKKHGASLLPLFFASSLFRLSSRRQLFKAWRESRVDAWRVSTTGGVEP